MTFTIALKGNCPFLFDEILAALLIWQIARIYVLWLVVNACHYDSNTLLSHTGHIIIFICQSTKLECPKCKCYVHLYLISVISALYVVYLKSLICTSISIRADVNAFDNFQWTALHHASHSGEVSDQM